MDIESERVDALNRGQAPFFEAGLEDLLRKNAGRNLNATTISMPRFWNSDVTMIAVGTPFDGQRDRSYSGSRRFRSNRRRAPRESPAITSSW